MNNFGKMIAKGLGIGFGITGVAFCAAWLVVKIADNGYPDISKLAIDGVKKLGKIATDRIPDNDEMKKIGEGMNAVNEFGAEVAKSAIDERIKYNSGW